MNETVIQVEHLSKMYRLGEVGTGTLSHDLNRWWHKVRGKEDPYLKIGQENKRDSTGGSKGYVWALRDLNFEVKAGEVLGIIGKNGAGKSTLLKVLSKVTGPTEGLIKTKGRVASLLEVGTGFHPELTGRENIFLNGTILGMTRAEVRRKLDEIVAFAGVAKYLDTPVKRYSSGMKVRLGFAVAAHLEPEILIVDEVLAVGDAEFQKKAVGKMQEVSQGDGRTVLFVSHNMESVKRLCNRGIIMEYGKITHYDDDMRNLVNTYLGFNQDTKVSWENDGRQYLNTHFHPLRMWLSDAASKELGEHISQSEDIFVNLSFQAATLDSRLLIGCRLFTVNGDPLFTTFATDTHPDQWPKIEKGINNLRFKLPKKLLNKGKYKLAVAARMHEKEWIILPSRSDVAVFFEISDLDNESPYYLKTRPNLLAPVLEWKRV
ncbi:MAG: ABC transporter ATP-binding protein [Bacteroidota bacterium]